MNKHTQKPWNIGALNTGPVAGSIPIYTEGYMESYRNGQLICSVYGTAAISKSNARLIAAAPDLLDALSLMLDRFRDTEGSHGQREKEVIENARAAIAKATGTA